MNAYLGENITVTCNYPGEYERNNKYIITLDDEAHVKPIIDTQTTSENSRFSISDDRSAKVLTVNISDVTEADGVFYLFGVWIKAGSIGYYSYFSQIQLHVTGEALFLAFYFLEEFSLAQTALFLPQLLPLHFSTL